MVIMYGQFKLTQLHMYYSNNCNGPLNPGHHGQNYYTLIALFCFVFHLILGHVQLGHVC